jgi:hypothetical protein
MTRRERIDRWLKTLGFRGIRVANKTWWKEKPTARDRMLLRRRGSNRLTSDSAARMLHMIDTCRIADKEGCRAMLDLLSRNPHRPKAGDPDKQAHLIGDGLPAGAKIWNKCGWTRRTCHDAALVELPAGRRLILSVFTKWPDRRDCTALSTLAKAIVRRL